MKLELELELKLETKLELELELELELKLESELNLEMRVYMELEHFKVTDFSNEEAPWTMDLRPTLRVSACPGSTSSW